MSATTDEDIRKQIGHRIKVRRVELELRQQDLADRLDLQQNHISDWEKGSRALVASTTANFSALLRSCARLGAGAAAGSAFTASARQL
jgi:transcriptional regulator with XRE-family HTH domain